MHLFQNLIFTPKTLTFVFTNFYDRGVEKVAEKSPGNKLFSKHELSRNPANGMQCSRSGQPAGITSAPYIRNYISHKNLFSDLCIHLWNVLNGLGNKPHDQQEQKSL